MSKKNIPVININPPNGGPQRPLNDVPEDQPVYSCYTGELIGYGGVPHETITDAPLGQHNGHYRVVQYNQSNGLYLAYRDTPQQPQINHRPSNGYYYW